MSTSAAVNGDLFKYYKEGNESQISSTAPNSDKSFTNVTALQRRQWRDMMSSPCFETKKELSSLLIALLLFRLTEKGLKQPTWSRMIVSVLAAIVGYFGTSSYFESRA